MPMEKCHRDNSNPSTRIRSNRPWSRIYSRFIKFLKFSFKPLKIGLKKVFVIWSKCISTRLSSIASFEYLRWCFTVKCISLALVVYLFVYFNFASNNDSSSIIESSYMDNEELTQELESPIIKLKRNKTLYDYLDNFKYFKYFETNKAREKDLCQLPDLKIWDLISPTTYTGKIL